MSRVASRVLRVSAGEIGKDEARALFRDYLLLVRRRVTMERRLKSISTPRLLDTLLKTLKCEEEMRWKFLLAWVGKDVTGRWLLGITGVGPVVAAGLLAHVDLNRMESVDSLWRYAGLDGPHDGRVYRPWWNPTLKAIAYWAGESFIKTKSQEGSFYGQLWTERRAYEEMQNNKGALKWEAERTLRKGYRWRKKTRETYEAGMLSPAHLSARARRWTVKIFLSHFYETLLWNEWRQVPEPLGKIRPPNLAVECGNPEQGSRSSTASERMR